MGSGGPLLPSLHLCCRDLAQVTWLQPLLSIPRSGLLLLTSTPFTINTYPGGGGDRKVQSDGPTCSSLWRNLVDSAEPLGRGGENCGRGPSDGLSPTACRILRPAGPFHCQEKDLALSPLFSSL